MKVGLLPLYIQLYDISSPEVRPRMEKFYERIAVEFEKRGITVERAEDFCRLKPEFEKTVADFEAAEVDAIVTLHMAYSPSLESIESLTTTELPIIVLDTTETLEFDNEQSDGEIMYNHGIHGVMDMCSMLKRYGKPYAIAAGHYKESSVIDEAIGFLKAAVAAKALSRAHVGLIGGAFEGMGDFAVEPSELKKRFGIEVEEIEVEVLKEFAAKVDDEEVEREVKKEQKSFEFPKEMNWEKYKNIEKICLGIRKCIEDKGLSAFSANFRKVNEMPFIECCKAMERGIGYAGEGDGLTSAFVGALLSAYPETGFIEIFCPDWKNNLLFLSHMGEVNYATIEGKPLVAYKNDFVDTYVAYARMKGGKGVYVNVSRDTDDYQLLLAATEIVSYDSDNFSTSMRGWMRPETGTTAEFLKKHSIHGATHHSIFVYGATIEEMEFFGRLLSMKVVVI